jgi:hypothetical protein
MASAKDKCFKKAMDNINEGRKAKGRDPLDIEYEKGWLRDSDGTWKPLNWAQERWRGFEHLWASIRKTFRIGKGDAPERPPGVSNPVQYRRPDITINHPDGSKTVIDNKFTGKDGKPDPWRTTDGMSGRKQQEDYESINKQEGNDMGEPKIDKDTCDCGKRSLEPETVPVYSTVPQFGQNPYFMPLPAPGGVPLPSLPSLPAPAPAPIPVFP